MGPADPEKPNPTKFPVRAKLSDLNKKTNPTLPYLPASTLTMKRKLDANDIPSPDPAEENNKDSNESNFETLNLDPRLRQALIQENFNRPTLVQSKAIPLALEGKDVIGMYILFFKANLS